MNRKNLTAAVLAGLAGVAGIVGSAQAVNINPDGLGQVLLYPYYTTNGGNVTFCQWLIPLMMLKPLRFVFLKEKTALRFWISTYICPRMMFGRPLLSLSRWIVRT